MQRLALIIVSSSVLFLSACAGQLQLPELAVAERSLADAYRSGAARLAPEQYDEASRALESANRHKEDGKELAARTALLDAITKAHAAEIATYRHQLESTEDQLDSAEEYILRLESQRNTYFDALSTIYDEQKLSEIKAKNTGNSYKPASSYRVRRGENLFAIAARRNVYGDALLWPLIYKANRDQIKDPQQIYPGQVLSIPRDISDEDKEAARTTARESNIFQPSGSGNGK